VRLAKAAVAGYPWLIINQREPLANQPVPEGRLADIGATDNDNLGKRHGFPPAAASKFLQANPGFPADCEIFDQTACDLAVIPDRTKRDLYLARDRVMSMNLGSSRSLGFTGTNLRHQRAARLESFRFKWNQKSLQLFVLPRFPIRPMSPSLSKPRLNILAFLRRFL